MNRYAQRSLQQELIDAPDVPFHDWHACLRELDIINTWLGGHRITLAGVQQLLPPGRGAVTIAEIGCGGGDNLKAIHRWAQRSGRPFRYIGIDLNKACVDYARENCRSLPDAQFIHSDYALVDFNGHAPDIIFSSLFCHHFSNAQLSHMLPWLRRHARAGFFINDLQRHPVAFHAIRLLTAAFSRSYLVRHDAPVSVLRGFRGSEWATLLQQAGITRYQISWKWAFRYLITVPNGR